MCAAVVFAVAVSRSGEQKVPAERPTAAYAPVVNAAPPPPVPAFSPDFSVAAVNANLRSEGRARSKPLGLIPRGTSLKRLEELGSFMRVKLQDGREGWVARELLIDLSDSIRLHTLDPKAYVATKGDWRALLASQVEPYRGLSNALLTEVIKDSTLVNQTMTEISGSVAVAIPTDSAAGTWYGLEAKSYADKAQILAAFDSALAAAAAEPSNPDRLVSAAFAAMKVQDYQLAKEMAGNLLLLAPKSTNTWVIVGATASMVDVEVLAQNAFLTALRLSRDTKVTQKFLADMSSNASDPRITAAIASALARWRAIDTGVQR